jgi:hypothetical protein
LEVIYLALIEDEKVGFNDGQRLLFIVEDLRWYSTRIGAKRWDTMPRDNVWSFHQNLWRLTRDANKSLELEENNINEWIDKGKKCVGAASEIILLLEKGKPESN